MKYEVFYLVAGSKEAELDAIKKGVEEIIISEGGVFDEKETIEKRKLAYQVKHETHGFYVARRFELDPEKNQSLTRKLNLYTGILRFVISKESELPELKTKEERIGAAQAQARRSKESTEKAAPAEVKEMKKEEKKEESAAKTPEKKDEEDIDKKLEEILNI